MEREALEFLEMVDYDLIILDIMMPRMDGFAFLEKIRQAGKAGRRLGFDGPWQFGRQDSGLGLGSRWLSGQAFEFEELLARLSGLFAAPAAWVGCSQKIDLGDIVLDLTKKLSWKMTIGLGADSQGIWSAGIPSSQSRSYSVSGSRFGDHVWDFDHEGESNIIDVLIKNICRKTDQDKKQSIIHTKRGVGYVIWNSE